MAWPAFAATDAGATSTCWRSQFSWLRANPHRFSLSRIGLTFADSRPLDFAKVAHTRQTLDLWSGTLTSRFTYDGQPVEVVTTGRHDPCVGLRAPPICEAMLALVLMDQALRHRAQCADVGPVSPRIPGGVE